MGRWAGGCGAVGVECSGAADIYWPVLSSLQAGSCRPVSRQSLVGLTERLFRSRVIPLSFGLGRPSPPCRVRRVVDGDGRLIRD